MRTQIVRETYFGISALIIGVISELFLGANYGVAYLDIAPDQFMQLNNLTALFFCILTPVTVVLGVLGFTRKNDSKAYSILAIALVTIPIFILYTLLIASIRR